MRLGHLALAGLLVSTGAALFACTSSTAPGGTSEEAEIVGGVDAKSPKLDAIGALLYRDPSTQQLGVLCSGTLIAKDVVLTAKHCVVEFSATSDGDGGVGPITETRFSEAFEVYFALGFDALTSTRLVRVTGVDLCMHHSGGAAQLGCDVATYRLAEPVADVTPLKVLDKHVGPDLVGQRVTAVGYGTQDVGGTKNGTRKAGSVTVRAVTGNAYAVLFPTLDQFGDAIERDEGPAFVTNNAAAITQLYDTPLEEGYELFAGGAPGDAQVCHGDSGGPILQRIGDELVVVGVASTVAISGTKLRCNLGGIHATFGPKAQELLARSAAPDPCEGVPPAGHCEGDVAVRCTDATEGPRRVTRTDCAAVLTRCVSGEDGGVVHCGD